MATNVYVDGFNLYNGCIRGTPYRWLDLRAFAQALVGKSEEISEVRYFTAPVIDSPNDPRQSERQNIYIRALKAHSSVEIQLGYFSTNIKRVRLVKRRPDGSWWDDAEVREEKGSDVKLAVNLVWDACRDSAMTQALVISNDADLQEAITMAMKLGKRVITVNPHHAEGQSNHLKGDDRRVIDERHLRRNQLPEKIIIPGGATLRKPNRW